jgi:outer membrane protein OmpA-like peptidoglycan-associated protein
MKLSPFLLTVFTCTAAISASDLNSGGFDGVHSVTSAAPLGLGGVNVGGTFRYGKDWDFVSSTTENKSKSAQLFSGDLFTGVGVGRNWDLALHLPFYADMPGWDDRSTGGIGDLEVATKMTLPVNSEQAVVNAALLFTLTTPTGTVSKGDLTRYTYNGESSFYTGDRFYYSPGVALTFNFDRSRTEHPVKLHLNAGSILCDESKYNSATAGMGLEIFPVEWLTLFTETYGTVRFERLYWEKFYSHLNNGQLWLSPGARFDLPNGIYMILSGDLGLSEKSVENHEEYRHGNSVYTTKENPLFNVRYTLGWEKKGKPRDSDNDSIPDITDNCPTEAEDFDGFKDGDGCPEIDNDNDGILDSLDNCALEAEDVDGFEDGDGCPDFDNDGDSILDSVDNCPESMEDIDGFDDGDGCPEFDNDSDSIPDSLDQCPNAPEDFDGFQDENGCPDFDNDEDSIADTVDQCPNVKGTENGHGCPEAMEISRDGLVLKGVTFAPGRAILKSSSYDVLDEVIESLKSWPEVTLEIQGHTDATGSRSTNLRISRERANTVRRYLIEAGIASSRLVAKGYGPDKPLADNSTADGRRMNRRVELKRTDNK